jgi:3-deoxy-D-manno-octulosonic-acid transferase
MADWTKSKPARRLAVRAVTSWIRFVWATSRWQVERGEIPRRLHEEKRPFILAFWHGRLLMMPMAWDRAVPIRMLISAHRDGRLIADSVALFGIGSIAGSSTRGGSAALRQMVRALREGACVGITPDGPRGPAEVASEGIVATARIARVPIVPLSYATRGRRVLGTWDRFHLALPFTRGIFVWGEPIEVPADAHDLEPWRREVEARLIALGDEAERAVGRNPLALYRAASSAMGPLLRAYLRYRRGRGKEDALRHAERCGEASRPRPPGPLAWLHAASVGEATSTLALVRRLVAERPGLTVLVTTGTVTSARLMAARLPAGAIHQYAPADRHAWVQRFLAHWRPDLAVWVESELWPNLVSATRARRIPMVLLNARLSARSFARWRRWAALAGELVGAFELVLAQDETQAARFRRLGARRALTVGDLKSAADPLPHDDAELARLQDALRGRPLWLAASTQPGEEAIVAEAHALLAARFPNLLTIVAPRHPSRADAVAALLPGVARRSRGEAPTAPFYLVDTLGELGLFYRLAGIVLVGASLVPKGGHNPLEPALLDCAVLMGPDRANCAAIAAELGVAEVRDGASLAAAIGGLLADPAERARRAAAAAQIAAGHRFVLDAVLDELRPFLDRIAPRRDAAVA